MRWLRRLGGTAENLQCFRVNIFESSLCHSHSYAPHHFRCIGVVFVPFPIFQPIECLTRSGLLREKSRRSTCDPPTFVTLIGQLFGLPLNIARSPPLSDHRAISSILLSGDFFEKYHVVV